MSGWTPDPFRAPQPQPPSELERLAREGQQRYAQFAAAGAQSADSAGLDHLRVALGVAFGTPTRRAIAAAHYASIAGFVVVLAASLGGMVPRELATSALVPLGIVAYALIFWRAFTAPRASRARCDEEARWVAALPFALHGYFEALRAQPAGLASLSVEVTFANAYAAARPDLMLSAARALDPGLRNFSAEPGRLRWTTSNIAGTTGIRVNRVPVYRNHRIPPFVHALVERTLLPMHREQAIARVALTRH